jgi:hypothetical protein
MDFEGIVNDFQERVIGLLHNANGNRRQRVLSLREIESVIRKSALDGWSTDNGGFVANRYGYPAVQTTALAVRRTDGAIALCVDVNSASKGTSVRPSCLRGIIPSLKNTDAIFNWADSAKSGHKIIVIPRDVYLAWLAATMLFSTEDSQREMAAQLFLVPKPAVMSDWAIRRVDIV